MLGVKNRTVCQLCEWGYAYLDKSTYKREHLKTARDQDDIIKERPHLPTAPDPNVSSLNWSISSSSSPRPWNASSSSSRGQSSKD